LFPGPEISLVFLDISGFHHPHFLTNILYAPFSISPLRNLEVTFETKSRLKKLCGFQNCRSLRRIIIPTSIEEIHFDAFTNCDSLLEVTFEENIWLRVIQGFHSCNSLSEITIPGFIRILEGFDSCKLLERLIFGGNSQLTEIHGFNNCNSLKKIVIPESVRSVNGFNNCDSLLRVDFADSSPRPTRESCHDSKFLLERDFFDDSPVTVSPPNLEGFHNCRSLVNVVFFTKEPNRTDSWT
jgi:hypothetical protein